MDCSKYVFPIYEIKFSEMFITWGNCIQSFQILCKTKDVKLHPIFDKEIHS